MRRPSLRFAWLTPRPIVHYVLALLLVLVVALGVLAGLVFHDTNRLKQQIAQADRDLARQELSEAVALLTERANAAAQAMMAWDEARQQLEDPTYYGYWRTSRALSAGVVPETIEAVDLYEPSGRNLSGEAASQAGLPVQLDTGRLRPYLKNEPNHDHLYFFFPFHQGGGQSRLLGYMGFKFDFQYELARLHKFRYLDLKSLRVVAPEGEHIELPHLVSALAFETLSNPETRELEKILTRSLFEIGAIIAVISLIGYAALISVVTKPLRRLSLHIDSMRRGQGGLLGDSYRGLLPVSELENIRQSLNDYQTQLDDMHVSLARKNRELWTLAHHDPLTGIFNRRAFEEDWEAARRAQDGAPLDVAFLLFDCDHFKAINDTYGHQVGDMVLQGLSESLHEALRAGDRLYRLGGDEFATLLYSTDLGQARQVAERCLECVNRFDFMDLGVKEPVRISVGIACQPGAQADSLKTLHRQADMAMYYAKRPGQGKVAVYSPDMGEGQEALVSNAENSAIYEALSDPDRLEMHYQPVLSLSSSRVEYYEALVRIRGDEGLIMPGSIFPVIELRGLECEFDLAVLERIRRDLDASRIPEGTGLSLNVSGPGIINGRIADKLMLLAPYLASYKVVIEVTETALITQIAQASANLNRLRKAGFLVALDDFGSGYSSLRYLAGMPVDLVKFDISMVRSLETQGRQAVFVADLAHLIKDAGYQLVAEGIESETMLLKVTQLGFSHAQGFHVGRPAPLVKQGKPELRVAV